MVESKSGVKPLIIPVNGGITPVHIDRVTSINPTSTLNREKVEEMGNPDVVGYIKKTPMVAYRLTQGEYGNIEFFRKLSNKSDATTSITLDDFKTSMFDLVSYLTDDDATFKGSLWYPKQRLAGFSFNAPSPDGKVERNFDFVGESHILWQGNNKYLIWQQATVASGEAGSYPITLDATAILDPTESVYMVRVIRYRGTTSTELTITTDYTENATTVTILSAQVGDIYTLVYTCTTLPGAYSLFTVNTTDVAGMLGDCVEIYLGTGAGSYLYRLQDLSLDVRLEREDLKELGNKNPVQYGVKNKAVTLGFNRFYENATIEEILAGQVTGYGKIDIAQLATDIKIYVKVFEDNTKTTFKWGFKVENCNVSETGNTASIDNYFQKNINLESENITLTTDVSVLTA